MEETLKGFGTGFAAGGGMSLLEANFSETMQKGTSVQVLGRVSANMASMGTRVGIVMGAFEAAKAVSASVRDKDDALNSLYAGLASGSLVGVLGGSRIKAMGGAVYGSVALGVLGFGLALSGAGRSIHTVLEDGATPLTPQLPAKY